MSEDKKYEVNAEGMEVTPDGKVILKKLPFTGVRRKMAQNLAESWHNNVSCTSFNKVDMSAVMAMKKKFTEEGRKVSYTDIFIRMIAVAVQENPMVNVCINEKKLEVYKNVNVGVAVSTPQGMVMTPVIKNADAKSVFEISRELKEVVRKINEGTVEMSDLEGGTVTISSLGNYEILGFAQVLVEPQSVIFGFGSINKEPVVLEDDTIGIRPMMYISDTTDHKAIHGITLMEFYKTFLAMFKDPEKYMEP